MNPQEDFKRDLERFITQVKTMPAFRGKTQVIRALQRLRNLAALN